MRRAIAIFAGSLLLAVALAEPAGAEKRVALVVGVGGYKALSIHDNPKRDAEAVKAALIANNYAVTHVPDPDFKTFLRTLDVFRQSSRDAEEAFIFFAGHGMEAMVEGAAQNILAPTDAEISCESRKALYTVTLPQLFQAIEGVPRQIVVIDACRDNPFRTCPTRRVAADFGFRGTLPPSLSGARTLLVFSTDQGATASDGAPGLGSPFARTLMNHLGRAPHAHFRDIFDEVAADLSQRGQRPWIVGIGGKVDGCLAGGRCGQTGESATPLPMIPAQPQTVASPLPQQVAVAAPPVVAPAPPKPAPSQEPDARALVLEIQQNLKRLGCMPAAAKATGGWDDQTRTALLRFNRRATHKVSVSSTPKDSDLAALKAVPGRLCPPQDCRPDQIEKGSRCLDPVSTVKQQPSVPRQTSAPAQQPEPAEPAVPMTLPRRNSDGAAIFKDAIEKNR